MKNLEKLFNELRAREVNVSSRKNERVISPIQLSAIKQELMAAIVADIAAVLNENEFVGIYENGVIVELENEFVDAISFEMNPKVKSLDFDAYEAVEAFKREQEIKAETKAQRKKDKAAEFANAQAKRKSTAK